MKLCLCAIEHVHMIQNGGFGDWLSKRQNFPVPKLPVQYLEYLLLIYYYLFIYYLLDGFYLEVLKYSPLLINEEETSNTDNNNNNNRQK